MELILIDGLLKRPSKIQGYEADHNVITPFKGRTIETDQTIDVYRNLNRKGRVYSIRQNGKVVAHTTAICIKDCEFIVNGSGKSRAINTMQRNVHAFVRGLYCTSGMGTSAERNDLPVSISYNPYLEKGFHNKSSGNELKGARFCIANEEGLKGSYTH